MTRLMLITAMLGAAACQSAPAPTPSAEPEAAASAEECPEIPETPRTDLLECDQAWRVKWCWIERTRQSESYRAGFRDGFEHYRVDIDDPMPREQVQHSCIEILDKSRAGAEAEGCWAGACVE